MKIISHRGLWKTINEKNNIIAFKKSIDLNYGIETDIRDYKGELVISHDIPTGGELLFETFIDLIKSNIPIALNIKADGLAVHLKCIMKKKNLNNWFVFDMSVPDMLSYIKEDIPVFCRMSEIERTPILFEKITGVWLDSFYDVWFDSNFVENLLLEKKVCIVSSELHGRNYENLWKMLKKIKSNDNLMLCTDYPELAYIYFNEE